MTNHERELYGDGLRVGLLLGTFLAGLIGTLAFWVMR